MSEWNVNQYLKACWHRAWLIVLVTLIAAGVSFAVSRALPRVYRASATVLTGEDGTNPNVKIEDFVTSQRLATGYAAMVKRQVILEPTVSALGLQMDWRLLQENVLAVPMSNTSILEIRVTDSDPRRAAAIANEITRQLILQSPTVAVMQQLDARRTFTQTQLDALQANIQSAEAEIAQKQAALDSESSARTIADIQDQIKGLQAKVTDWRAQYGTLLKDTPMRGPNTITVVESAVPPLQPVSPNVLFNVLLASFAGLLLALGGVFILEYLGAGRVRTVADAERALGVPSLGAIGVTGKLSGSVPQALATANPHSPMAEAFRVIRTNVRFAWGAPEPMIVLVTSPGGGEGKSTISANLATSFAQAGKQTVLVDADLRNPTLHRLLGAAQGDGLSSLLTYHDWPGGSVMGSSRSSSLSARTAEILVETAIPNLSLLRAGPPPSVNPGELLTSPVLGHVLELLRDSADVVIIDSPPVLTAADTAILGGSQLGVGIVLVVESNKTTTRALTLAVETLMRTGAHVLGSVLNKSTSMPIPYGTYGAASEPAPPSRRHAAGLVGRS